MINMKRIITLFVIAAAMLSANPLPSQASVPGRVTIQDNKQKADKTETVVFETSMHCDKCAKKITENISFVKGVKDMKADLPTKTVTVKYDPSKTDKSKLAAAIKRLGYTATEKASK